ncbi:MAG: MnhB domain-containing protein [Planctomycetota bacterium]
MERKSLIVRTVARWVVAFIFLYGLHIVAFGHLTPGGGFPGGVILASAFVLEVLAWGKDSALGAFPFRIAKRLDSAGAFLFLLLALLGLAVGGQFFVNFIQKASPGRPLRLFNGGIIPLANAAVAIKVCASLFLVMVVLSALRVVAGGTERDLTTQEEE